jgi:type II secretory pathway pseudopilin PulG
MQSLNTCQSLLARRRQNGLTLIETLVAVLLGLIVLAGVFTIFATTLSGSKLSDAEQNLTTVVLNAKQLYSGQPNFSGLSNSIAYKASVFPTNMATSATDITNKWHGQVTIKANANPRLFDVTYEKVPQSECIKLASFQYGQWSALKINGTTIDQTAGTSPTTTAATACQDGDANTLVWTAG